MKNVWARIMEMANRPSRARVFGTTLMLLFVSGVASAVYNANISGVLTNVMTYTDQAYIYFRLDNQPASHPSCNSSYFVIDSNTPSDIRSQLLARLLLAYSIGESINIGYDNLGDCVGGYIRVHRVG